MKIIDFIMNNSQRSNVAKNTHVRTSRRKRRFEKMSRVRGLAVNFEHVTYSRMRRRTAAWTWTTFACQWQLRTNIPEYVTSTHPLQANQKSCLIVNPSASVVVLLCTPSSYWRGALHDQLINCFEIEGDQQNSGLFLNKLTLSIKTRLKRLKCFNTRRTRPLICCDIFKYIVSFKYVVSFIFFGCHATLPRDMLKTVAEETLNMYGYLL